ncbi:hypothetical protein ONZ45_g17774 [Pleurotus djamor]|nr:hypothetical protein ONZ45_g17774 [Pleurotus djamor]
MLTLVTTRPLKVLYFDGSSAAKMLNGSMDSQDILLWGAAKPEFVFAERLRIAELCEWGRAYGVDGYVRMEMDFEIMLCDFSSGVETSSFLNLTSQHDWRGRQPSYEVIIAGSWHNNYPGETRIVLDLSRLVSGYDVSLFPSLIKRRRGQERWQHRLDGMSDTDVATLQSKVADFLRDDTNLSMHRVDWATLIKTIYNRYSDRLPIVQYLINNSTSSGYTLDSAQKIQRQLRTMLSPYILGRVVPSTSGNLWASPIYKECSVSHTSYIASVKPTLTPSEQTILLSVEETSQEICRIITRMWADGVVAGIDKAEGSSNRDLQTLVTGVCGYSATRLVASRNSVTSRHGRSLVDGQASLDLDPITPPQRALVKKRHLKTIGSFPNLTQGSGVPVPPVPSSPPSSGGVRRHHTISASSRSARQGAREIISEESAEQHWTEDEVVDQDWVVQGALGAVGEKTSLHRQSSLPARYPRTFQNRASRTGTSTPKPMNSLTAIAGHEGDEEDWERDMRGLSVNDDETSEALQHPQVIDAANPSPLSPHFSTHNQAVPSPPPAGAAGVRRHVSLTYGAGTGTASTRYHSCLSRTTVVRP